MNTPFRKILIPAAITIAAFFSLAYAACKKDKCKSVVCAHGGVCNQGSCICPAGYQGANCQTVSRLKFLGNWYVSEKGSITNPAQYTISISASDNITNVAITNCFNYFQVPISGYVSNDTLHIPNQQYQGKVIFGVGYIYSDQTHGQYGAISMSYEVIDTATNVPDDFGFYPPDLSAPSAWNR